MKRNNHAGLWLGLALLFVGLYVGLTAGTSIVVAARPVAQATDAPYCTPFASGTSFTAIAVTSTPVATDIEGSPIPTATHQRYRRSALSDTSPALTQAEWILAFGTVVSWIVVLVLVALQHWRDKSVIPGLTGAIVAMTQNKSTMDTVEPVLSKVIPKPAVNSANRFADFLETVADDEQDALIEAVRGWLNKVTDGLPNESAAG